MHLKCQFWGKFAHFSQREFHIRKYHGKILAILLASREWSPSNTVPHLFWVIKPFPKSCCLVLFQLKSLFLTAEVLLVYTLLTLHLSASAQLSAATLLLLDFFLLSPLELPSCLTLRCCCWPFLFCSCGLTAAITCHHLSSAEQRKPCEGGEETGGV